MKSRTTRHVNALCFVLFSLSLTIWGCTDHRLPTDPDPDPSNPDRVVTYDPAIEGVFVGDDTKVFPDDIQPRPNLNTSFKDNETNTIPDDVIKGVGDVSMDEFIAAYEAVLAEFPNIDKSSNEFAEKIIEKIKLKKKPGRLRAPTAPQNTIIDRWNRLTPQEKDLVFKNPLKGYKTKNAAESAEATTVLLFGGNGRKTRSDAFRHSYWNFLMSAACSVEWARTFATAHESLEEYNDETRMDLNNNIIGRRVFLSNPSASEVQAQESLLNHKLLWINEKQKNVEVGIDYLVYLVPPIQSLTAFDDGPSYDDIYDIMLNGKYLGTTPAGGSKAFQFSQMPSGTHNLNIVCKLDGTKGGCGFAIILEGALRLSNGQTETPQIVIQETGAYSDKLTFPTMKERKND